MTFDLHERLAADCDVLGDMALCRILLMRDHRFPWTILVPRIGALRDFHDLPRDEALTLFDEVGHVSRALVNAFAAEKINVAALGNQVPQLHVQSSVALPRAPLGRGRCGTRALSKTRTWAS